MMGYKEFGSILLQTFDLDPLYVILTDMNMPSKLLKRFLLAYYVYYSAGVAAYVAESKDFYATLYQGKANWPRGHERRHMRAQNFDKCIAGLTKVGKPETVIELMMHGKTFQDISTSVQTFPQFGPWMAWKVADMAERVVRLPVDFSNAEIGVYRDPVKGAALIEYGDQNHPIDLDQLHTTYNRLIKEFHRFSAPPYMDRPVNIQEMETVACKYKSYVNGHYPPGYDTMEIYDGLEGWGDLAQELRDKLLPYYSVVKTTVSALKEA